MKQPAAIALPLSKVTLIFGVLSVPLAFLRHLVSLAVVLAVLAIAFGLLGRWLHRRHTGRYSPASTRYSTLGLRAGTIGLACALVMWWLWAGNVLL